MLDGFRFWMQENLLTFGPFGLMIPARNATDSWDPAESNMRNKFICESVALLKTDEMNDADANLKSAVLGAV